MSADFQELKHLFGNAEALPQIPDSPLRLAQLLEAPDPSPSQIEEIIHSDPALTAGVLRMASSAIYARPRPVTTIREATALLGHKALRSLAVGLWTNALIGCKAPRSKLDLTRFANNGNFVGTLARLIHAELKIEPVDGEWTGEELLAAGALHNVMFGLLSHVSPEAFDKIFRLAEGHQTSLDQTFLMIHGHPISDLAARTAYALGLPDFFVHVTLASGKVVEEATRSQLCLQTAKLIAESRGIGLEGWQIEHSLTERSLLDQERLMILAELATQQPGLLAA